MGATTKPGVILPRGVRKPARPVLDPTHPLSRGLIGCWPQGDAANGVAPDISGRGKRGTYVNGPLTLIGGSHGGLGTLYAAASSQSTSVDLSAYDGITSATFVAWVKRSNTAPSTDQLSGFCGLGVAGASTRTHYPYLDGNIYIGLFGVSTRPINGYADSGFDKTAWHQFVLVNTPGTGGYQFWRNGALVTSTTGLSSCSLTSADAFGASGFTSGLWFDGAIENVRLYDRALSQAEIQQLYAEPYAGVFEVGAQSYFVGTPGVAFTWQQLVQDNQPVSNPVEIIGA